MARRGFAIDRRGVTAIEFALLLPIFLTLLFGIIEFAQVLFIQVALQHGVTGAARCASQFSAANSLGASNNPTDCSSVANVQTVAVQQAFGFTFATSVFTPTLNSNGYNCVAASYPFSFNVVFTQYVMTLTANSCYPVAPSS